MKNGLKFDVLFGVAASVIAVAAGTYLFSTPFTNEEIARNFATSAIASFAARHVAKYVGIRVSV